MKKRWIVRIVFLFVLGILTGCSHKDSSIDLESGMLAKGRFVEEEIKIPQNLKNSLYIDCLVYDNKIEILSYSKETNQYYDYIYDGEKWKSENINFENIQDKISIKGFAINSDHEKYFYGYDENQEYYILSADQNAPSLLPMWSSSLSSAYGPARIDKVVFQEDGTILVSIQDKAALFSKEGQILHEFAQDYNEGMTREASFLSDTSYVTLLNKKLVSYSLKDGEMQELNNEQSFDTWPCIFSDIEGSIYIANREGIYHINENSTIIEKVIDGTLTSMSLQSDVIRKLYKNNQNTYFCVMRNSVDGSVSVFRYTFNPEISTLPQDTLTVYSLNNSNTLRQAAVFMQRQNPNVRVDIRIAMGEEYESLSEDIIRSLNAELLNGKGADVLVLDGLPKEAYKEKGVLLNLKDLFEEIQKESSVLPNIMQNYVDSQENIYYFPVRFKMPVMFGEKEAVEVLSQMALSENKDAVVPVLAADNYGNLERLILNICYKQVFTNDGRGLSEENLKIYLKSVKMLGEKVQAKVKFTPDEMELLEVDNVISDFGNRRNNSVAFARDMTRGGFECIGSVQDSVFTFAALKEKQVEMKTLDGIFYPELVVGINKNSENQELAQEFLKVLYSDSIQTQDLVDGFGVLEAAVLNWENVERDTKMIISDYDGSIILSAFWPEKENRIKIIEMINSLKTPIDIDPVIMSIITEYSQSYYDGSQDLDTTINKILNKVTLYKEE